MSITARKWPGLYLPHRSVVSFFGSNLESKALEYLFISCLLGINK